MTADGAKAAVVVRLPSLIESASVHYGKVRLPCKRKANQGAKYLTSFRFWKMSEKWEDSLITQTPPSERQSMQ